MKPGAAKSVARRVIVSIDALRPEFFDADRFKMPALQRLASEGYRIARVNPGFPSHTYPMHASLVTGATSIEHGVVSNMRWRTALDKSPQWFWEAKEFRVPPLWQTAKQRGLRVAILRWPTSFGAEVDWLIPEIFRTPGIHPREDWEYALSRMDPAFAQTLQREAGDVQVSDLEALDSWTAAAAGYVLRETDAQLILTHWVSADIAQHRFGRESPALDRSLAVLDRNLTQLVARLDPSRDQLFVVGDHGMADVGRKIHANVWLAAKGWFGRGKGKALAHAEGGNAAIYLGEGGPSAEAVAEYLADKCGNLCRVLSRADLDREAALPEAALALVASAGYAFGDKTAGKAIESLARVEGQHGYPSAGNPEMDTSFVAWGRGWSGQKSEAQGDWRSVARILRESLE